MEIDTESTNTSAEDKTEDFCENPTRDALTEGLMRLLKPTIDQLDEKIRTIRISQVEFRQQIENLSNELKKINEANSEKDFDLEVYIKKLVTVKQKLTVVSNILQNSEERLLKLQQSIAKESSSQKALLETSNIKHTAVLEPIVIIPSENKMYESSIKTPQLNHIKKSDWDYVYEPAEDSFLLMDALEQDLQFLYSMKPGVVLEVGSGSGIIITALSQVFNSSSHCLAIDINSQACKVTKCTSEHNQAVVDVLQGDLTSCLKESSVDMIIFNPPYVVTPGDEVNSNDLLTKSWAGGTDGVEVINKFLATFQSRMRPKGFGYILLLKENNCENIMEKLRQLHFKSEIIIKRKIRGEELFVVNQFIPLDSCLKTRHTFFGKDTFGVLWASAPYIYDNERIFWELFYKLKNATIMLLKPRFHQLLLPVRRDLFLCFRLQHTAAKTSPVDSGPPNHVKPTFRYAEEYSEKFALHDSKGEYTYKSIFSSSFKLSKEINSLLENKQNERVAFLCPNDGSYIIAQWAAWMSGQIVVPLSKLHPASLLEYFITDSGAKLLVTTPEYSEKLSAISQQTKTKLLVIDENLLNEAVVRKQAKCADVTVNPPHEPNPRLDGGRQPEFYQNSDAMIVYTSGTTGNPKGVIITHRNIHHQVHSMISAWGWTSKDTVLHTLPLHHVHGIVNALITPLSVGAKIIMLPEFNCNEVWSQLLLVKKQLADKITLFTGVPTMYAKLIDDFDSLFQVNKRQSEFIKTILSQKVRLMISGSAPLRPQIIQRWKEISGHTLLERYGMTETGMVLSNPLIGERKPGFVGQPMPDVTVRITQRDNPKEVLVEGDSLKSTVVTEQEPGKSISGDLWVKGPTVFRAYWNKPNATAKEFDGEWFKTGDTAEYVDGWYKILGRSSVDIIKTGGFKISALEVEAQLMQHENIQDVAVVGVPDLTWGEKVAAVLVLKPETSLSLADLREWCKHKLASYAIPTELKIVDKIPRNNMDKINKRELLKTIFKVKQTS